MAVKILAADDSATMRKVLEMTFAGEGVDLTTVDSGQAALERASADPPDLVIADASMDMSGYDVAAALKSNAATANVAVIVLASQHNPYDAAKGKGAGVDDHILKPYDSQAMIDKAKEVLSKPRAQAAAGAAPPRPVPPSPPSPPKPAGVAKPKAPSASPRSTVAFGAVQPPKPPAEKPRLELAEDQAPSAPKPPALKKPAAPKPVAKAPAKPAAPAASKPTAAKPAAAAARATASGGDMAAKLAGLGLTKEQVDGVLALSRDVIERVVWEVVPDLAEVLIKEEIRRLTAD